MKNDLENQLRRQSAWLKESFLWILKTKVLDLAPRSDRPTALDVGCGPGLTIEALSTIMHIKGVDIDPEMVLAAKSRRADVTLGDAEDLPFENDSFDIAYCSFLLMWVHDPQKVVEEMKRVSRGWVIALAEPDYGARLDYPPELSRLTELIEEGIREEGGDPYVGRRLRQLFCHVGIEAELGVHMGIWNIKRLGHESSDEWRWLEMTVSKDKRDELRSLRPAWERALEQGSLFQFNPIFYALGRKR